VVVAVAPIKRVDLLQVGLHLWTTVHFYFLSG